MIDSEPVPWGKGEKNPGEGSEIVTETVCLQRAGALLGASQAGDGVPIEEWPNEFIYTANSKFLWNEGIGKPSVNSAY